MSTQPPDLATIIYRLSILEQDGKTIQAPINRAQETIEALKNTQAVHAEKIQNMTEEIKELKQDLKAAKQEIIASQKESLNRFIVVQTAIMVLLGGGIFGLIELFLHH